MAVSDHPLDLKAGLGDYQRLLPVLEQRDRMEEAQIRARVLLERTDISLSVRARTHNLLCWTFIEGLRRPSPEAVLHGEEARRLAVKLGEREILMQALANLAHAHTQMGNYDPASECYQELLQHLHTHEDLLPFGKTIAHMGLGYLYAVCRRYDEALGSYARAEADCRAQGSRYFIADLSRRKALVLIKLERMAEAVEALSGIDETTIDASGRSMWWKPVFLASKARLEFALGNLTAAREIATNTLVLAKELGNYDVMAETSCLLAQIDFHEGRKDAVRRGRCALTYAIASGRRDVVDEVRERIGHLLGAEG